MACIVVGLTRQGWPEGGQSPAMAAGVGMDGHGVELAEICWPSRRRVGRRRLGLFFGGAGACLEVDGDEGGAEEVVCGSGTK